MEVKTALILTPLVTSTLIISGGIQPHGAVTRMFHVIREKKNTKV
jgi:hypothetical protein